MSASRKEWMDFFRRAYQYGSPRKIAYVSPQAHASLREAFGADYASPLDVAGFKLRLVETAKCPPDTAYVVDAA